MENLHEDPAWKVFFKENPKPTHFEENLAIIHDFCQNSAAKKQRVALVTVIIKTIMNLTFALMHTEGL